MGATDTPDVEEAVGACNSAGEASDGEQGVDCALDALGMLAGAELGAACVPAGEGTAGELAWCNR